MGFTWCKAQKPLQYMQLQEKGEGKEKILKANKRKNEPKWKKCLLTLDI